MSNNPFLNSRRIRRTTNLLPARGGPGSIQSGGDIGGNLRDAPHLSQLGAKAAQIASAGAFAPSADAKNAPLVSNINPLNYANVLLLPFSVDTLDTIILPAPTRKRVYLFVQNTHPTQSLFLNFDTEANTFCVPLVPAAGGVPGGWFEWINFVPQNIVHAIANGAGTTGVLIYAESDV